MPGHVTAPPRAATWSGRRSRNRNYGWIVNALKTHVRPVSRHSKINAQRHLSVESLQSITSACSKRSEERAHRERCVNDACRSRGPPPTLAGSWDGWIGRRDPSEAAGNDLADRDTALQRAPTLPGQPPDDAKYLIPERRVIFQHASSPCRSRRHRCSRRQGRRHPCRAGAGNCSTTNRSIHRGPARDRRRRAT